MLRTEASQDHPLFPIEVFLMQQQGQDFGAVFGRSWQLLSGNWVIIVPGIIIGIVAGLIVGFLATTGVVSGAVLGSAGAPAAGFVSVILAGLVSAIVVTIATLISVAYTSGMAAAAWRTGTATFADGAAAFSREGASLFTAMILLFLIGLVAFLLAPFTLALSVAAYAIFFIYTIPSVVVDDVPGMEAVSGSFRLALANFVPTLIIIVLIGVIAMLAGFVGHLFNGIPFLGWMIQFALQQAVVAYAMLVVVGEYM
ncbi:MAG: hypothetical protein M3126_01535, partial [Candidatus Eremiobacteraeota bacterium]|nr:hypothetical protein [Candidatus Eremiobacteraeota bacterium]